MKVILLRHATRNTHELGDPPLNQIGLVQAKELIHALPPQGLMPVPTLILSSPKKRARETLAPISLFTQRSVAIDERLDERHQSESPKAFEARVHDLLASLTETDEKCVLICSHLDWLEAAFMSLNDLIDGSDVPFAWATAEYKIFQFENGQWSRN